MRQREEQLVYLDNPYACMEFVGIAPKYDSSRSLIDRYRSGRAVSEGCLTTRQLCSAARVHCVTSTDDRLAVEAVSSAYYKPRGATALLQPPCLSSETHAARAVLLRNRFSPICVWFQRNRRARKPASQAHFQDALQVSPVASDGAGQPLRVQRCESAGA